MDLSDSYDNWVGRFDLACASKSKVGFILSAFFIGWISTLIFIPRFSDLYGRSHLIKIASFIHLFAYGVIMVTRNYAVLIACMFTFGAMATIRAQVVILYLYENLSKKNYTMTYAGISILEGFVAVGAALYFMYASKNWIWLGLIGWVMQACGGIMTLMFNESPTFLIKSG